MEFTWVLLSILALVVFYFMLSVKIVPQTDQWVIERLGKYHKTIYGGLNFIVPFIDTRRSRFSTQEQIIDIPSQSVITKDNVGIQIDGLVFIVINDSKSATYEVLDLKRAIGQLAQTTLRSEIGKMDLDETLSSRDTLNTALTTALDTASENWGTKVKRVEVADIQVPPNVQKAMELQMEAEREKRAVETTAQGQKNATIAKAEGDKQRAVLEAEALERTAEALKLEKERLAEGDKNSMEMINEAMEKNQEAAKFLLAKESIEAFSKLAESNSANKIVVPFETSGVMGSIAVLSEMLSKNSEGK